MEATPQSLQGLKSPARAERQPLIDSDIILAEPGGRQEQEAKALQFFVTLALLFYAGNSGVAIYLARGDPWTVVFVAGVSLNLLLLFSALRAYEKMPAWDAGRRGKLKVAIWVLATTLNVTIAFHVAAMMPPALSVVIWCMAVVVSLAGFWLLIVHRERGDDLKACTSDKSPYHPWNEEKL